MTMRIALAAAGMVLVGATSAACGGSADDAPEDASKGDFCDVVIENNPFTDQDDPPSQDDFDDWVDELKDVGTPDNISDEARDGYEVLVDALDDIDVDDIDQDEDFDKYVDDEDDRLDVEAFSTYLIGECVGDLPTGLPSDLPSDLPSGLPTDLPSDLLTDLPSDFPTDIPTSLPSEYLSMLSDLATAYPSE